jgi:ABC-2 type transport system permease protein
MSAHRTRGIARLWAVTAASWRHGLAEAVAYRASTFVWILTTAFPLISLALWRALARDGAIGGFDGDDFAVYFVAVFLVRQLTSSWIVWDLDSAIRRGELSALLLRPASPLHFLALLNLAHLPVRLAIAAPLGFAVLLALGLPQPDLGVPGLLAWPLAIMLAWAINFAGQVAVGSLAFWITSAAPLWELWIGLQIALSGVSVPIELFPPWLATLARWLPFHAQLGFPTELLVGRVPAADVVGGLLRQLLWATVLGLAAFTTWRRGLRVYGAEGG